MEYFGCLILLFLHFGFQTSSANSLCDNFVCHNDGKCTVGNVHHIQFVYCACKHGFQSQHCQYKNCHDFPCHNGGRCHAAWMYDTYLNLQCNCPSGYTGTHCETAVTIDPCSSNPCRHQGTCVPNQHNTDFTCRCMTGYQGKHCEHHVCDISPCIHGSCQHQNAMPYFKCTCDNGFAGSLCKEHICQSLNIYCGNGTCSPQATSPYYKCTCPNGYIGQHCEHNVCDIQPCSHGSCHLSRSMPYFSCKCDHGFSGSLCQDSLTTTTTPAPVTTTMTPDSLTTTTTPAPVKTTMTPEFATCDKYSTLGDISRGESIGNNDTTCPSGSHISPEAFVLNNCNVTSAYTTWQKGIKVMEVCHGKVGLPTYSPVGIFVNEKYLDSLNGGTAGEFLGCLPDGGFKFGVQDCDGTPVIRHINGSHFAMNPYVYFGIV